MQKLNFSRFFKTFLFLISTIFLLKYNIFSQTYHDCTSTQDFNNFLEQNSSSEEMLDLMELEFSKSLSKFDKCLDSDYLETKNKEEQNELKNSEKLENPGEESAEQKEQEGESSGKELVEQKEQEGESSGKELVEQKAKGTIEDSAKKLQEIDKQEGKSDKANNDYNNFSSKNNREEFLNNKNTNNNIVDSVASSELSGTEINEDSLEGAATFENNISEGTVEYDNDQRFEQAEKNNGMIPEDIPQDDNDSVLEEQIRLAAMNEKDPEKKKRLWNEYRKYKGLPQKE